MKDTNEQPYKEVAQGLNSSEIRLNDSIPFVDDIVELDNVRAEEPIRPKRQKDVESGETDPFSPRDRIIHASDLGAVHSSNSDTIVVNTPEGTLYITLDPDSSKPSSPNTQSINLESPTTSKAFGAEDSRDLIDNEKDEVERRKTNLRRNSISMPTLPNLELEVMRQQYLNNPQDEVSVFITLIWLSLESRDNHCYF